MTRNELAQPGRARWRSPRQWLLTAATLAMVALTFSLGQWQTGRAEQKRALAQAQAERAAEPPLDSRALLKSDNLALDVHRRVRLQGQWIPEHSVYLENRPMKGRPDFGC